MRKVLLQRLLLQKTYNNPIVGKIGVYVEDLSRYELYHIVKDA